MVKFYNSVFLLALCAATAATFTEQEDLSAYEAQQIAKLIQDLQLQDARNHNSVSYGHSNHHSDNHHHHDVDHGDHRDDDHDFANVHTLNLILKHNNIATKSTSRPRSGAESEPSVDDDKSRMCELGARCGCRGRSGEPCDHDHTDDSMTLLDANLSDLKNQLKNDLEPHKIINLDINQNNMKYGVNANVAIQNLLGDLEKSLANDNEELEERHSSNDSDDPKADKNIIKFLDDLESALVGGTRDINNNNDKDYDDEGDRRPVLRCCRNCAMRSFLRTNDFNTNEDNDNDRKSYLRCCRRCGKKKRHYRTINVEPKVSPDQDEDGAFLRCCKNCYQRSFFRTTDWNPNNIHDDEKIAEIALRCYKNGSKMNKKQNHDSDAKVHNNDRVNQFDRAKIYQLNDDLDAVVLDVSEIDNILKLLNNGNNFDNVNPVGDYIRAGNTKLVPKVNAIPRSQKTLLPLTVKQKEKLMNRMSSSNRRSVVPDVARYGLPFELDVQGLGQANP